MPASLEIALVLANHAQLATLAPKVQDIIDEMQAEAAAEASGNQAEDDDDLEVAAALPPPPSGLPRRAPRPATVTPRLSGLVSRRQLDAQQQEQERLLAAQEQQLQEEQAQARRQQQRARSANRVSFGISSKRSAVAAVVSPPKAEVGEAAGSFSDDDEGGEEVDADTADEDEVGEEGAENNGEEGGEEEAYELANNEDELQHDSPPASPVKKAKPFNPFGKKDQGVMASPPKKRKNVFELLAATASPSPKKAPKLSTKASAMVKSAHSKRNKLRGVL